MKKRLALTALTALLVGCGDTGSSPRNKTVENQTLALGPKLSATLQQSFDGSWRITNVPDWLQVSATQGTGSIQVVVTAVRSKATPAAANQPSLSGTFTVVWTPTGTSNSSSSVVTVKADQYLLKGRVTAASVSGQDVLQKAVPVGGQQAASLQATGSQAAANQTAANQTDTDSHGIIVQYRDSALRNAVATPSLSAQASSQGKAQSRQLEQQSRAVLSRLGVQAGQVELLGERSAVVPLTATAEHLAALRADPNVLSAVPNAVMREQTIQSQVLQAQALEQPVTPTDQYAPLQWAFSLLGYPAVWRDMEDQAYVRPVTVAVVDSGVRYDHPDLVGKLYGPGDGALDLVTGTARGDGDDVDNDPTDPNGPNKDGSHGTHVTGIIVANWGTNRTATCAACSPTGVVGASYLAPVMVLPIRVIDTSGVTDVATVTNGVLYAAGIPITVAGQTYTNPHPAQVINLSLGGDENQVTATEAQTLCDAVAQAHARGVLVVAAAGNSGNTLLYYPAACEGAVSVASVTLSGNSLPIHADYSNAYAQVQLSAPGGVGLVATYFNGGTLQDKPFADRIISTGWDYTKNEPTYEIESGTSQAAPQVSALAALLLSKGVTQSADDTLARMVATATDLGTPGRDPQFGYGMINAAAALNAPQISNKLGLSLQDALGQSYFPAVDALGNFSAYLGDGTYRVTGGLDSNGNGIAGETGEPSATQSVTLGPASPSVDIGNLLVK